MAEKLSPVQKQVLVDLYKNGYEIAAETSINPSAWMKKRNTSLIKKITHATIDALYTRKLICEMGRTNTHYIYDLTEKGIEVAKKIVAEK